MVNGTAGTWGGQTKATKAKGKKEVSKEVVLLDRSGLNVRLQMVHAHGLTGMIRNNVEMLTIKDEHGMGRDHVLQPVGQGLGVMRLEDQRMCFIEGSNSRTNRPGAVRSVISMTISPNRKDVAICERVIEPTDASIISDVAPNPKGHGHSNYSEGDAHGDDKGGLPQYFVSVHRNVTSSLLHSKITLTFAPPATTTSPGGGPPGGVRFSRLAWSADSKILAAIADGELDDDEDGDYRSGSTGDQGQAGTTVGGGSQTPNTNPNPGSRRGTPSNGQAQATGGGGGAGGNGGVGFAGGGADKFVTLAVWEWSKDKVVGQCHYLQNPKERVECNRLTFCPTDKNVLTSTGNCSLKQWSVPSTGGEISAKSLLPPNKSQEHFVDHAWMAGKSAGGSDVPDRRLVVLTGGGVVSSAAGAAGAGGGGAGTGERSGAMTPAGGSGNEGFGAVSGFGSSLSLARSKSSASLVGGRERAYQILVFQPSAETPGLLELVKQTSVALPLPLSPGAPFACVETLVPYGKGFVVGGSQGFLQVWNRTDVGKDLYSCVKSVFGEADGPGGGGGGGSSSSLQNSGGGGGGGGGGGPANAKLGWSGANACFSSLAVASNDEVLVCATKARELVSFPLGSLDLMADAELASATADHTNGFGNGEPSPSAGLLHFSRLGGAHEHGKKVTCMAVCLGMPLLATGSEDQTVRVWDYSKWRGACDNVVLDCREDGDGEPVALALHPSGQQILVGYRERVRLMRVLHKELKPHRELSITKCRALAYTAGGNLFAAASSINVSVYDALTLVELQAFTGHVAPIQTVTWANNGLSLYSSGLDGHVYGWDLTTGLRIDEVSALNNTGTPCGNGFVVLVPHSPYGAAPATGGKKGIGEAKSRPGSPPSAKPPGGSGSSSHGNGNGGNAHETAAGRAEAARMARMATALTISGDGSLREVTWLYGAGGTNAQGEGGGGGGSAGANKSAGGKSGGGTGGGAGQGGGEDDVGPLLRRTAALISTEAATSGATRAHAAASAKGRGLFTTLAKCNGKPFLFAGTSNGCIHVYAWPLRFVVTAAQKEAQEAAAQALEDGGGVGGVGGGGTGQDGELGSEERAVADAGSALQTICSEQLPPHLEVPATACGACVEQLQVSCDDALLFCGGSDGSVLVFKINELEPSEVGLGVGAHRMGLSAPLSAVAALSSKEGNVEGPILAPEAACEPLSAMSLQALQASITSELFNSEVVQVSLEDLEERQQEMEELRRKIENLVSENDFQLSMKEKEWEFKLKTVSEASEEHLEQEQARYEALEQSHLEAQTTHDHTLSRREALHGQTTLELEASYEFKLGLEMERYDLLSEEIEKVQQKCEALLVCQKEEHQRGLREHDANCRRTERELATTIDKLADNEKHNKAMFREVLDQQEAEYETELQALIVAAQEELAAERSNTGRMRVMVQEYQSRINDLKSQLDGVKAETHRVDQALTGHKVKNQKMEATLEHFKRHMQERESTLEDKETAILELRRRNTTLDNFRFVLDHRVQQLVEERGPISTHINGLEGHIDGMYEELEKEYSLKKLTDQQLDAKAMKINTLASELGVLRGELRTKESYINAFKRDLCGLVSLTNSSQPKDVEDGVRDAYYRYVKEERPRNDSGANSGGGGSGGKKKNSTTALAGKAAVKGHAQSMVAGGTDGNSLFEPTELDNGHDHNATGKGKGSSGGGGKAGTAGGVGGGKGGGPQGDGGGGAGAVQSADSVEMDLALREAYHQRDCVEKLKDSLARKLEVTKKEHARSEMRKLEENSSLMSECNALRQENLLLKRKADHLRQVMRHFEHDDKKRREDSKTKNRQQQQQQPGGSRQRPSTAGMAASTAAFPRTPGQGQEKVGPRNSIDTTMTDPFQPLPAAGSSPGWQPPLPEQGQTLLTVKRVATTPWSNGEGSLVSGGGSGCGNESSKGQQQQQRVPKSGDRSLGAGGGCGGRQQLSARAGRARVMEQNLNLSSQLDENERIIAMQKLEIGQLRGHLGVATQPHQQHKHDLAPHSSSSKPREVISLRAKKSMEDGNAGTHGLYSPEDPAGPFSSKQAQLQER